MSGKNCFYTRISFIFQHFFMACFMFEDINLDKLEETRVILNPFDYIINAVKENSIVNKRSVEAHARECYWVIFP